VRTARAWRFAASWVSGPAGSSTTNELRLGNRWFCQFGAVPRGQRMARNLIPARRAYSRATGLLGPHARTSACGWWNQIVTDGLMRRMSRAAARVSGSESGLGPGYSESHGRPPARHSDGKLRLRSTPRAFWRRPSAKPSGLRFETTQRSTAEEERARMRVTAVPAHSFPWMQPTTSARVGLVVSPARKA
jgi:hypothetical protein